MKKFISIMLSISILFTCLITANADNISAFSLKSEINGDLLTITVSSNTTFSAFNLRLYYDKQTLTPVSLKECEILKNSDSITSNLNGKIYTEDYVSAVWVDLKKIEETGEIFKVSFKINNAIKPTTLKLECIELLQDNNAVSGIAPVEINVNLFSHSVNTPAITQKSNSNKIKYMNDYGNEFRPLKYATRYEIVDALYNLFDFTDINNSITLTDVDDSYKLKVASFVSTGIVSGYPDGTFKGNNNITRAEFVKLLTTAFNLAETDPGKDYFTDTSECWAKSYINTFASNGYAKGYLNPDGTYSFRPDDYVTRVECVAFINRIINAAGTPSTKTYTDLSGDFWGYNEIMKAVK